MKTHTLILSAALVLGLTSCGNSYNPKEIARIDEADELTAEQTDVALDGTKTLYIEKSPNSKPTSATSAKICLKAVLRASANVRPEPEAASPTMPMLPCTASTKTK